MGAQRIPICQIDADAVDLPMSRLSGRLSFVAVMQSTDLWQGHDSSYFRRLNRPVLGRVLPYKCAAFASSRSFPPEIL